MLTQQDIQHLLIKFTTYATREKPILTLEYLPNINPQNPQDFVTHINSKIQRESLLLDQIVNETIAVVKAFSQIYEENLSKFDELNMGINHKDIEIEELKYKCQWIEKERANLAMANKVLQEEIQSLRASMENMEQSYIKENQTMKSKLEDQQTLSERSFEIYQQQFHERSFNLAQESILVQQQKMQLQQKVQELMAKLKETDEQLEKIERKLNWEQKVKEQLEETIKQKEKTIQQLSHEVQQVKETLKQHYEQLEVNYELFRPPAQIDEENETQKYMLKLSEDVENKVFEGNLLETEQSEAIGQSGKIQQNIHTFLPQSTAFERSQYYLSMNRASTQTTEFIPVQRRQTSSKFSNKTPSKYKKSLNLDPYYCHYVLLSQTIKITQNCQHFFDIDIKPYYKEIIAQKIPMNEWNEWIISKFQKLAQERQQNEYKMEQKNMKNNKSKENKRESIKGIQLIPINS